MKHIFAIVGSASADSANLKLIKRIAASTSEVFTIHIFEALKTIPHFDADLSIGNTPQSVLDFRELIENTH